MRAPGEEAYGSVRQAARRGGLVEPAVPAGEDCWVIVFGFSAADMEKLMQVPRCPPHLLPDG